MYIIAYLIKHMVLSNTALQYTHNQIGGVYCNALGMKFYSTLVCMYKCILLHDNYCEIIL